MVIAMYPTKYMGTATDMFGRLEFLCRASKIELLMLVSSIMVISRLKNTQWHFYEIYGMP